MSSLTVMIIGKRAFARIAFPLHVALVLLGYRLCPVLVVRFSLLRLGFFLASPFVSKERAATQEPTNFSSRIQLIGTVQRTGTLSGIPNGCGEPPRQSAH